MVKKLLKKEKQEYLSMFGGKYRFSPYMACGHRCVYCDGRYEKYRVKGDFDSDIVVRENAPLLLERELARLREPGPVCISSGVSDPYQPVEQQLEITRQCAEILSRFNHPVIIHTKSSLVLRDIDYWEEVHKKSGFTLMVSLTMTDDSIRSGVEPGASSVQERLETLHEFRSRGMNAGVLAMPFIPFLTDSKQQMRKFLEAMKNCSVQFAMPGLLTLKQGRQKDYFLGWLAENHLPLLDRITDLYSHGDSYGNPSSGYAKNFYRSVHALWAEYSIDELIPHSVFKGQFSLCDEISILLRDMGILYRCRGISISRLKAASMNYSRWLQQRRTYYAARRNMNYRSLDDELRLMAESQDLEKMLGNRKLAGFLKGISDGSVLNYITLQPSD